MLIFLYGFKGKFTGNSEYDYTFPSVNEVHDCMLFLSQKNDEPAYEIATKENRKFGFTEVEYKYANKLNIEILNTDKYKGFTRFYEEALQEGSSLVYYPNI